MENIVRDTLYEDEISSGIQEQEDGEHCKRYPI